VVLAGEGRPGRDRVGVRGGALARLARIRAVQAMHLSLEAGEDWRSERAIRAAMAGQFPVRYVTQGEVPWPDAAGSRDPGERLLHQAGGCGPGPEVGI
jgi:hypothetical protein